MLKFWDLDGTARLVQGIRVIPGIEVREIKI